MPDNYLALVSERIFIISRSSSNELLPKNIAAYKLKKAALLKKYSIFDFYSNIRPKQFK